MAKALDPVAEMLESLERQLLAYDGEDATLTLTRGDGRTLTLPTFALHGNASDPLKRYIDGEIELHEAEKQLDQQLGLAKRPRIEERRKQIRDALKQRKAEIAAYVKETG